MDKKKTIIVDVDGTIADMTHRLHYIRGPGKKDWDKCFSQMDKDTPIENVVSMVIGFAEDYSIAIVTARPERYREVTETWLKENKIVYDVLLMRKDNDKRDDDIIKRELLNKYFKKDNVYLAIDDRPRVVNMYKEELGPDKVLDVGDGKEF